MKYYYVKHKEKDISNIFITLKKFPNKIEKFFGAKTKEVVFYGSCTVWHEYPSCKRCGLGIEIMLSRFEEKIKNGFYDFGDHSSMSIVKNYSDEVKPLSSEELEWANNLEEVLLSCPTDRISLVTKGDNELKVIDGEVANKYDLEIADDGAHRHGVVLWVITSKPIIEGVSG